MGRKVKIKDMFLVKGEKNIDRRENGYYSTPEFVSEYIARRLLELNKNIKKILDPCCGREELTKRFRNMNIKIDGMDIIQYKDEYYCNFKKIDFIEYYSERKKLISGKGMVNGNPESIELDYDIYIANPPYNCHEVNYIKNNKVDLLKAFSDVGIHNMYSMFISSLIDFAKEGAIIGLITCDSFFTSKHHQRLREKIVNNCVIHEITMCPVELFISQGAEVRTSILILEKCEGEEVRRKNNKIIINNRPLNSFELKNILNADMNNRNIKRRTINDIVMSRDEDNNEIVIDCPDDIKDLFRYDRLGGIFNCITGISTGNDKKYLSKIKDETFNVPFYKNPGKDRFYTEKILYLHKDFMEFDKEVKNFNVRNKQSLFKGGISCSSMGVTFTASVLPSQVTYGVNANIICEDDDKWWLLSYLNSRLVTYFVRGILIRSNMITSGYVSRIPILEFDNEELKQLSKLAKEAYEIKKAQKGIITHVLFKIDEIVYRRSQISEKSIKFINEFTENIVKST